MGILGQRPESFSGLFDVPSYVFIQGTQDHNVGIYLSFSLNSLKGGYIRDYIGDYYRGY